MSTSHLQSNTCPVSISPPHTHCSLLPLPDLGKGEEKRHDYDFLCPSVSGFCSVRHGLAVIVHLCNFSVNSQKMSLSIAMPAMVTGTARPGPLNATAGRPSTDSQDGWNETLQQLEAVVSLMRLQSLSLTHMA